MHKDEGQDGLDGKADGYLGQGGRIDDPGERLEKRGVGQSQKGKQDVKETNGGGECGKQEREDSNQYADN